MIDVQIDTKKIAIVKCAHTHTSCIQFAIMMIWICIEINGFQWMWNELSWVDLLNASNVHCCFSGLFFFLDFPGMCFASTKCATFEPGKSWDLTPFCGRSTCVVANDNSGRYVMHFILYGKQRSNLQLTKTKNCNFFLFSSFSKASRASWRLWPIANWKQSLQIGYGANKQIGTIPILLPEIHLRKRS